jgi:hypothetical protein
MKWVKKGAIILYRLPDDLIVSKHFIVVDEIEVRIEHPQMDDFKNIRAMYCLYYRRLGFHIKKKFEEIKRQAILVKPESF